MSRGGPPGPLFVMSAPSGASAAPGSGPPVLALGGLPAPADLPALHRRVTALARSSGTLVIDLGAFTGGGLAALDLLARLALTARRHGCAVRLRRTPPELAALLGAVGLDEVLGPDSGGCGPGSGGCGPDSGRCDPDSGRCGPGSGS